MRGKSENRKSGTKRRGGLAGSLSADPGRRRFIGLRPIGLGIVVLPMIVESALLSQSAKADDQTWSNTTTGSGGTNNWATGTNWSGTPVPGSTSTTNSDTATFNNNVSGRLAPLSGTGGSTYRLKSIKFSNASAGSFTFDNAFVLTDGGVIQIDAVGSSRTVQFNRSLTLNGTSYSFVNNSTNSGSVFRMGANSSTTNTITGKAGGTTTLTLSGSAPGATNNLIFLWIQNGTSGNELGITKEGNTRWTISSNFNTYTGPTQINAGILRAGAGTQSLGNNSAFTLADTVGATLDLGDSTQSIGSLAGGGSTGGNVTLGSGTLTTGGNDADTAFAGLISGTGGVTKTGNGVQTFSGNNSYSGLTNVSGGALRISGSTTGQGDFGVVSNATLGGTGTIGLASGKKVSIAAGGHLAPGTTADGLLAITGSQTGTPSAGDATVSLASEAIFDVDLLGSGADQLNVTGNVDLDGATLAVNRTVPLTADQYFTIILNDGVAADDAILGTFADLPEGQTVLTADGYNLKITYKGHLNALSAIGNDVVLYTTPVPEVAGASALGLSLMGLLSRRRRV